VAVGGLLVVAGCQGKGIGFGPRGQARAEYTILCLETAEPGHARHAQALADMLRAVQGLDRGAVRVDSGPNASRIYYGRYAQRTNPHSGLGEPEPRAAADRDRIRGLALGGADAYPFLLARVVPLPWQSSVPAEWELSCCPGVYTLQVAIFYDTPPGFTQRREAAEQAVALFRQRGYEAWLYHGESRSTVCVGSFDESAVLIGPDGKQRHGPAVVALQDAEEDFQYNTHNGRVVYRNIGGHKVPEASFLIRVPESDLWAP
jgi:hypothetical protein